MPQQPGHLPTRRPAPRPPKSGRPDDDDHQDDDRGKDKRFGRKRPKGWLDPYGVPSSYHMDQMLPLGTEFERLFPRFHPSWLQRIQTPVPRVSAFPLHFRGYSPQGGVGHAGGVGAGRR